jgi:trigger factor
MDVEVTKLPESRVALKISLAPDEVDQALDRTYKQLAQRVNVPGFRKGKAPRPIIERVLGQEVFLHEATEEAVRWGYRRALDQEDLTPIDEARISESEGEHDHLHPGEPFQFEATVTVRPEVQLPDYRSISLEREVRPVEESDIDTLLLELRERNATLEPVARPGQLDDVVTIKITGKIDGETVLDNENADLELYDEQAEGRQPHPQVPGLIAELIGKNRGELFQSVLQLPATYPNPDYAGKTMIVNGIVKEVKRKVLPEADDDFAQSVSDVETLAELRERLRDNLEQEQQNQAEEKLASDAVEQVVSRSFVEIPPILVEEQIDQEVDDMRRSFEGQGISLDRYFEATGRTEQQLRQEMRESVTQSVKNTLVLNAVADAEGIETSNREVDAAIEEMLRALPTSQAERRNIRSSTRVRSNIRGRLRRRRAIARLVEVMTGGDEVSSEAAEAAVEMTTDDNEATVAVEVGS